MAYLSGTSERNCLPVTMVAEKTTAVPEAPFSPVYPQVCVRASFILMLPFEVVVSLSCHTALIGDFYVGCKLVTKSRGGVGLG